MLYDNHQANLEICTQVFPNLTWVIESDSINGAIYTGNSSTPLSVRIEANTEGFTELLQWDNTINLIAPARPSLSLLSALQSLKTEWVKLNEAMS